MAISAVVYCSNTGHTKHYAQMFAEKTGLPLYDGAQAQKALPRDARIVFFGWLLSGKIQGFEKAWTKFDVAAACSVGLYPDSERFRAYVERNNILIDTQYFHLRGGIAPEKLRGMPRVTMGVIMRSIRARKKQGKDVTQEELAMLEAYDTAADFVEENALLPVYEWYESQGE